jgi:hypothetical protein
MMRAVYGGLVNRGDCRAQRRKGLVTMYLRTGGADLPTWYMWSPTYKGQTRLNQQLTEHVPRKTHFTCRLDYDVFEMTAMSLHALPGNR